VQVSAYLWNKNQKLSGTLDVSEQGVVFSFQDFEKSNLQLNIPFSKIEKVELYSVFDLAQNGLKIKTTEGMEDDFVVENTKRIKREIDFFIKKR